MFKKIMLCICVLLTITGCGKFKDKLGKGNKNENTVVETLSAEQVKNEITKLNDEYYDIQGIMNTFNTRVEELERKVKSLEETKVSESEEKDDSNEVTKRSEDSAVNELFKLEMDDNPLAQIKEKIAEVSVKDISGLSTSEKITVKSNIMELTSDDLVDKSYPNISVVSTLVEEKYSERTIESLNNESYSNKEKKYDWIIQYDMKEILGNIVNSISDKYAGLVVQITYER